MGRFISSDPIRLDAGLNTYTYVLDSPLVYVDPYGLWFAVPSEGYGGAWDMWRAYRDMRDANTDSSDAYSIAVEIVKHRGAVQVVKTLRV